MSVNNKLFPRDIYAPVNNGNQAVLMAPVFMSITVAGLLFQANFFKHPSTPETKGCFVLEVCTYSHETTKTNTRQAP